MRVRQLFNSKDALTTNGPFFAEARSIFLFLYSGSSICKAVEEVDEKRARAVSRPCRISRSHTSSLSPLLFKRNLLSPEAPVLAGERPRSSDRFRTSDPLDAMLEIKNCRKKEKKRVPQGDNWTDQASPSRRVLVC